MKKRRRKKNRPYIPLTEEDIQIMKKAFLMEGSRVFGRLEELCKTLRFQLGSLKNLEKEMRFVKSQIAKTEADVIKLLKKYNPR